MKNTKRSITFKVIAGYFLLTALAVFVIWFIYGQIVTISENAEAGNINNQKLFLVSEAATNLYVAEGISRDIVQNQKAGELPRFRQQIDTITVIIDSLKVLSGEVEMSVELDSIKKLLQLKNKNLEELLILRQEATTESYYTKVINRLQRVDETFEDENYEEQLSDLDPTARRAIIGFIEFSKQNRAEELTQRTSDSLVNALKMVLNNLETQERRIMLSINQKENELLENDRIISNQLRDLRAAIEQDEIQKSIDQVTGSRDLLERTSLIIGGVGIVSILTIFIFGILIFRDTNKSQKYRQELESSKNYTESLLKSREQIMAAVTHDLRSPLNTVIGYSDLLSKSELNNKQQHYLDNLRTSSDYILRLVNDLLDLSKLEAGKMHIEKMRFNLANVINESVKNAIPNENAKDIEVKINIEKQLEKDIISDPFRLQQILTNLISNAYKFTDAGEITIRAGIKTIHKNPNTLKIKVIDTGIGISKEHQKVVFEEFSQADKNIEKLYGGYGLGLAITKKLVTLLKGGIYLESKLNRGSTFAFYVPVDFPEKKASSEYYPEDKEISDSFYGKNILIVDDEPSQLVLTSEILKDMGLHIETASNGRQALEKLNKNNFDLVLTDIQMPGMDGFELLEKIRENEKTSEIPVIALSGNTDLTPDEFVKKGFTAKLTKPYGKTELLKLVSVNRKEIDKPDLTNEVVPEEMGEYSLQDIHLFTQGDPNSLIAIIETFIQSTHLNIRELEIAIDKRDTYKISLIAHKMLPMFRQLRITACIGYLEKMEAYEQGFTVNKEALIKFKEKTFQVLASLEAEITV